MHYKKFIKKYGEKKARKRLEYLEVPVGGSFLTINKTTGGRYVRWYYDLNGVNGHIPIGKKDTVKEVVRSVVLQALDTLD